MAQSFYLILRPAPNTATGEMAYQITAAEAQAALKDGSAVMLPDGILREVKVRKATYSRKDMAPDDAGSASAADEPADKPADESAKKKSSGSAKKKG